MNRKLFIVVAVLIGVCVGLITYIVVNANRQDDVQKMQSKVGLADTNTPGSSAKEQTQKNQVQSSGNTGTQSAANVQTGTQINPQLNAQANAQLGAQANTQAGTQTNTQASSQAKAQADVQADAQAKVQSDAQAKANAQAKAKADAQADYDKLVSEIEQRKQNDPNYYNAGSGIFSQADYDAIDLEMAQDRLNDPSYGVSLGSSGTQSTNGYSSYSQPYNYSQPSGGNSSYTDSKTICAACSGDGSCKVCNGYGTYTLLGYSSTCSHCGGTGKCPSCGGKGYY